MTEDTPEKQNGPRVTTTHVDLAETVSIGGRQKLERTGEKVSQTIGIADGGSMKIEKPGGQIIEITFKDGVVTVRDRGMEKKYSAKKVEVAQGGGKHTIFLDGDELV